MSERAGEMYGWAVASREVLLDYCQEMPPGDLTRCLQGFGIPSVRGQLVHMAGAYVYWLEGFGFSAPKPMPDEKDHPDMGAVRALFDEVNGLVAVFLKRLATNMDEGITRKLAWLEDPVTLSPRWLLAHAVTHEFHHKGQVVAMGRLMGHIPPDTDLLSPPRRGG